MALLTATALLGLSLLTALGRYEMEQVYEGANFGNVNAVPSLIALDTLRRNFLLLGTNLQRQLNSSDDVARRGGETGGHLPPGRGHGHHQVRDRRLPGQRLFCRCQGQDVPVRGKSGLGAL
ncbi:hypothetical protein [Massilia sp. erpn]|uniref:hypothetical protein n=1 Tax=Massilia sp. erpn TaxID=2738142 RepID=UPI0021055C38|nr:hypothetical protein [Massilia sp. erpn]